MAPKQQQPAKKQAAAATPSKAARPKVALGTSPHADAAAGTELARNALARDRYEFLLKSIFGLIVLLVVSILGNVYLGTRPVEYRYFTTDPQGGIREIVALNRPIQSTNEILNWATQVATKAYSMSFANYGQQLDEIRPNFTEPGWRGYEQALQRSGFTERLLNQQFVTTAVPTSAPVIVAEGLVEGVYAWRLQVPLTVTYQSASANTSQNINVELTIVRRPETENPKGLGIAQIVSR